MKTLYFANGKEYTEDVEKGETTWLVEMAKKQKDGITEWRVKTVTNSKLENRTWLESMAIMTLKEKVLPKEACILRIFEEDGIFLLKVYRDGYIVTEKYDIAREKSLRPISVKKTCDSKKIKISFQAPWHKQDVICTVNWSNHTKPLTIKISDNEYNTVMSIRDEIGNYLDKLNPDRIDCIDSFLELSKMIGSKHFEIYYAEQDDNRKRKNGVYGSLYGSEFIEEAYQVKPCYTLGYLGNGSIYYADNSAWILFDTPEKTFDLFSIYFGESTMYINSVEFKQLCNTIEVAKEKAEEFYKKISKIL